MKIYDAADGELMQVTPKEARAALKLLDFKTILFILSLLFRRG
jgi:hypothetical protein